MRLKELRDIQQDLTWPESGNDLPVVSWATCMCLFFDKFLQY